MTSKSVRLIFSDKRKNKFKNRYFIQNNNPGGEPQRFNIVFKGETTGRMFRDDVQLEEGETKEENDYKYKASDYDEVCMTFNPSVTAGGITTSARRISEYCRPIIQKGGPPTIIAPQDKTTDDSLPGADEVLW